LFCEVESILNCRPITLVSNDAGDPEPLTPNNLLLIHQRNVQPPGYFTKDDNFVRRKWRQIQYLQDQFWKRWIREYLPLLQQRQKWFLPKRNLQHNDIVLVMDNAPRNNWPMARVVDVTQDKKGLVRSVKLQIGTSILQRPVHKLCLLLEADSKEM
jgi:hypothetical protein